MAAPSTKSVQLAAASCAQIITAGYEIKMLQPDSFLAPQWAQKCLPDSKIDFKALQSEFKFLPREDVKSRAGSYLTRRMAAIVKTQSSPNGAVIYPYYGSWTGAVPMAHHATTELNAQNTPIVHSIWKRLETLYPQVFQNVNQCLGTLYEDVNDHIAFHSDKTADLMENMPIVCLSFGSTRQFSLRRIMRKSDDDVEVVDLAEGDLFWLGWDSNLNCEHNIIKGTGDAGPRISLIFRCVETHKTEKQIASLWRASIKSQEKAPAAKRKREQISEVIKRLKTSDH